MRQIINKNQRGFLYKDGDFVRMLNPGKYRVWRMLGQSVKVVEAEGRIEEPPTKMAALLADAEFVAQTVGVEVADEQLAIAFADGRIQDVLGTDWNFPVHLTEKAEENGSYRFWNIFRKITFETLDTSQAEAAGEVPTRYFEHFPPYYYLRMDIDEGEAGLLFIDGAFVRQLGSGTHYFWNRRRNVACKKVDMRVQQMEASGQEMLTADKVTVRMNFLCSFRVTDPVRMETELRGAQEQIYSAVQLALREYVGGLRLDALLEQKADIAVQVLEALHGVQERLSVEFVDAGLKDIILPGEIRDIMNTVLVAEKNAQANVISRREEVASTRSLLNTAKLLEENATLARLKELEMLERIFDKVGNISVSTGDALLSQLQAIVGSGKA